jgi:protein O-GlcNAc transferase
MYRETVAVRIREAMERQPIFLDSLAASDAFGDIIETAYDEVALGGRSTLRAEATPLLAANSIPDTDLRPGSLRHARLALRTTPNDTKARHAVGKAYLDLGEYARAADYLLAAVQNDEGNAGLWYDLSIALHRNGQTQHAIQALEGSLRIDQNQLEAWLLLAQLAKAVDQHDMAREAATVAQSLAPRDPRISAYL